MNFKFFLISLVICFLILTIPAFVNVSNIHKEKLMLVTTKRIEEAGLLCYKKGDCDTTKIFLKNLYSLGYLEKESNPITKEYYLDNCFVLIDGTDASFVEVN